MCVVALLLFSLDLSSSTEPEEKAKEKYLKVLVDESRVHAVDEETRRAYIAEFEELVEEWEKSLQFLGIYVDIQVKCDARYSFQNLGEPWGFGLMKEKLEDFASVTIRNSGALTYATLMKYDILVIASFNKEYSAAEVGAITKFVENGGGLLLFGDRDSENNSVSEAFHVSFYQGTGYIADAGAEQVTDIHTFIIDHISSHPITKDIKRIILKNGVPIMSHKTGDVLAATGSDSWMDSEGEGMGTQDKGEEDGPFDILLAMEDFGKGRAVFFGGALSFWNEITADEESGNLDLFLNAVKWLGTPGGPYKQYVILNEEAQALLEEGIALYDTHSFGEAEEKLGDALDTSEKCFDIYPNSESSRIMEEARSFVELCGKGLEANRFFDSAESLFGKREYEKAIGEYEKAMALYTEIEYTERSDGCRSKIGESNRMIALRDEALSLFDQAEEKLNQKSGMFDVTGFEAARSLFEQSQEKWEEYDDPGKVAACEEKIEFCNSEISRVGQTKMMIGGGVIGAVIICGLAVFFLGRRRKKAQT